MSEIKNLEDLYRYIAYGYLIKNYSKKFLARVQYHVVKASITEEKCTAVIDCKATGNGFNLYIDLKKKKILHQGCYTEHKRYPNVDLIQNALDRFNK